MMDVGVVACSASDTTLPPCLLKLIQLELLHYGRKLENDLANSSFFLLLLNQIVSQRK